MRFFVTILTVCFIKFCLDLVLVGLNALDPSDYEKIGLENFDIGKFRDMNTRFCEHTVFFMSDLLIWFFFILF